MGLGGEVRKGEVTATRQIGAGSETVRKEEEGKRGRKEAEGPLMLRSLQGPFCSGIWDMVRSRGGWVAGLRCPRVSLSLKQRFLGLPQRPKLVGGKKKGGGRRASPARHKLEC